MLGAEDTRHMGRGRRRRSPTRLLLRTSCCIPTGSCSQPPQRHISRGPLKPRGGGGLCESRGAGGTGPSEGWGPSGGLGTTPAANSPEIHPAVVVFATFPRSPESNSVGVCPELMGAPGLQFTEAN